MRERKREVKFFTGIVLFSFLVLFLARHGTPSRACPCEEDDDKDDDDE